MGEKFCNPKDLPSGTCLRIRARRTGGRAVEGTALEMRHTCKGIVGSNPTLSAISMDFREVPSTDDC